MDSATEKGVLVNRYLQYSGPALEALELFHVLLYIKMGQTMLDYCVS